MTDFFADLEAEIRAAHPRRSRPVVPVRTLAVAASVLVAIAAAATFLPGAEQEVAQQSPPVATDGWTAYAPEAGGCGTKAVDGPGPKALLDRFQILRKPRDSGAWEGDVPAIATRYYPDAARATGDDRGDFAAVIVPVEFSDGTDCEALTPGVCLLSMTGDLQACSALTSREEPMLAVATADEPGDRRRVFILAEDSVDGVRYAFRSERRVESEGEVDLTDNWIGFRSGAGPDERFTVESIVAGATLFYDEVPGGACGTTFTDSPVPAPLADALGVLRSDLPRTPRAQWMDRGGITGEYLLGAHVDDARVVTEDRTSGRSWIVLAVSELPRGHRIDDCDAPRVPAGGEPGACAVHLRGDGAASEQKASCWTLTDVEEGRAVAEFRDGDLRTIYGLVPDTAKRVEFWEGAQTRPEHNLVRLSTREDREVRLRFVE